jgi:hypothetical protein
MRIEVRLPKLEPGVYGEVKECPQCGGQHFKPHGVRGERKAIRDLRHEEVKRKGALPQRVASSPERLGRDLERLQEMVRARPEGALEQLETMYDRYKAAPAPKKGQRHTVWYRTRMLVTRLWDRWPNLTLDQRRDDLDGTNNRCERVIGWWIKERYRTMRGYKRPESIHNVVTLTARLGVRSGRYDMTELYMETPAGHSPGDPGQLQAASAT